MHASMGHCPFERREREKLRRISAYQVIRSSDHDHARYLSQTGALIYDQRGMKRNHENCSPGDSGRGGDREESLQRLKEARKPEAITYQRSSVKISGATSRAT